MMMFSIIVIAGPFTVINAELLCGIDSLPPEHKRQDDYTGNTNIESFPWLGTLLYPVYGRQYSVGVVLVTRQIVLTSALEIHNMPKKDFRKLAKIYMGQNCSTKGIPVREYIYHPEFIKNTMSSLALIQMDLDHVKQELIPICPPPNIFAHTKFYAVRMYTGSDCFNPLINIFKMDYVSTEDCHNYYRRSGLEMAVLWPKFPACGRAFETRECVWSAGTVLAAYQKNKWRLVGIGLYGPGCSAPSKYMDYLMYRRWVMHNVVVPGRTTMTEMAQNHIILRRSLSHVRRFGPCDEEESRYEIYSEKTTVDQDVERTGKAKYNLTLVDNVEYSCVVLRARHFTNTTTPKLKLRRWCASTSRFCYDQHHVEIKFHVIITFSGPTTYEVSAYGQQVKTMDPFEAMKYINRYALRPRLPPYNEFRRMFSADDGGYQWVKGWQDGSYEGFKIRRYEVYEHCMSNATMPYDLRFCGQYEFTVEPERWWKPRPEYKGYNRELKDHIHFVWRYLSQRKKLQYPLDGYELIIDPEIQDLHNEIAERMQYLMRFFPLYDPPDYVYKIYPFYEEDKYKYFVPDVGGPNG